MGTFAYKWEVQHTILISPKSDLPKIESNNVVANLEDLFTGGCADWNILSSHFETRVPMNNLKFGHLNSWLHNGSQKWQCLSFAFQMKNETDVLNVGSVEQTFVEYEKVFKIQGKVFKTTESAEEEYNKLPNQ